MELNQDVFDNQIILIVTSKTNYNQTLQNTLNSLKSKINQEKICYVTLNKPYNTIQNNLKNKEFPLDKFYFIDGITSTVETPEPVDNCTFISSPSALTDLSLAFSEALKEHECDNAIFDTISTLMVYQDIHSVIKLVHNLVTKIRVLNKKSIFLALTEDSKELIKDLNMFVDKVIELE